MCCMQILDAHVLVLVEVGSKLSNLAFQLAIGLDHEPRMLLLFKTINGVLNNAPKA